MARHCPRRRCPLVGHGAGGMSCASRRRVSQEFNLGLQGLDDARLRLGLDQHENHSGFHLLFYRDADRTIQTMAGKRSHGPAFETRSGQLSGDPDAASGFTFKEAVLTSKQ